MVNGELGTLFSVGRVTHLTAISFDHRPLLLETTSTDPGSPKPFKFESMWIKDGDSGRVIVEAWNTRVNGQPLFQLVSRL